MHRFFQMWQQVNGGKNDLFVWTAETVGAVAEILSDYPDLPVVLLTVTTPRAWRSRVGRCWSWM